MNMELLVVAHMRTLTFVLTASTVARQDMFAITVYVDLGDRFVFLMMATEVPLVVVTQTFHVFRVLIAQIIGVVQDKHAFALMNMELLVVVRMRTLTFALIASLVVRRDMFATTVYLDLGGRFVFLMTAVLSPLAAAVLVILVVRLFALSVCHQTEHMDPVTCLHAKEI